MVTFLDGPAEGVSLLLLRRAPLFLRVTAANEQLPGLEGDTEWDALDLLDDEPNEGERIFVYRRAGEASVFHIHNRGRNKARGFYAMADYRHVPEAPADELANNSDWRRWVERTAADEGLVLG